MTECGRSAEATPPPVGACRFGVLVVARAPSGAARECSEYQMRGRNRRQAKRTCRRGMAVVETRANEHVRRGCGAVKRNRL